MKRIFTLLFLASVCYVSNAQKLVLVEEFTQASCPPCETTTPALNTILEANEDKVVQIRYQTSWPGVDPMNADNPEEVQARVDYYGVTGVPDLIVNGSEPVGPVFPELITQANIDSEAALPTPVTMTVSHTIAEDLASVDVTVSITNTGTEAYSVATNRLRVAIVEEVISWPTPPGSTSILDYEYVMKRFLGGVAGVEIPEIAAGETFEITMAGEAVPGVVYDFNTLAVVGWIQDDSDRSVANAAVSHAIELAGYADLAIASTSSAAGGLCDYAFTGQATVTNPSQTAVTEYNVDMLINGEVVQNQTITTELAVGAAATVDFDEINLPPGTSAINFALNVPAGDVASLNNSTAAIVVGKASEPAATVRKDYESDVIGALPTGAIIDRPFPNLNFIVINQTGLGANNPLGGFGMSANTVMINFWNWNPANLAATGGMTIGEQFSVPEGGASLTFDHAYTSWGGSQDRLSIEVSTDCGESFEQVWTAAGSDLATAPELNSNDAFFVPAVGQWAANSVDMSDFAGKDVLVRFAVSSAWGDMLYIDNVIMQMSTGLTELNAEESVSVYPNPAQTSTTIDLEITEAADVSYQVIDMLGRVVANQSIGQNLSGSVTHSVDVSDYDNGTYLIYVKVGEREAVERISIVH